MRCSLCDEEAVIDQPYAGQHLCDRHFRRTIVERLRREMHRQLPRFPGGTVAVALSGGKDSAVALTLAHRYFARRPNVHLVALTVDEGIEGYRLPTIERAAELCKNLDVPHEILRARDEVGSTTDEAALRMVGTAPCSFCGVWRRQLLNRAAVRAGADVLVLGFNLDDLAQTILMNLARADLDRIPRMAPHRSRQPGLVPRIAPLATIPEREVYLYARLEGLPFDHGECPHARRAARNVFREAVWNLEEALPGTRHGLLKTQERLQALFETVKPSRAPSLCSECGEPSTGAVCRACEYRRAAREPLAGGEGISP
ncbi:MAG: TIGR00269 family protein [Thermoplasmata archaeon]|nr:TIGR00269 family protein [Thermoplasmata archaeon]